MSSYAACTTSPFAFSTRAVWKVAKPTDGPKQTRSRKGAKSRSWTETEKSYLLRSRERRISYRRIAASLGKTELACRLHYHQLTVVKPRQTEEAYTPPVHPQCTPASIGSPWSPETTHTRNLTASPPSMEQRTLPSLTKWFEQCGHHRSISLPTRLAAQPSGSQYEQDMKAPYVQLAPPTPSTPNMQSPFTSLHAGLGVTSVYGHTRARSYSSARGMSPQLFAPTPMLSPDVSWGRPRAARCSSVSSNGSWGGLSPPHSHTNPVSTNTSVANNDRCSVHSLLNHEDGN